MSQRRDASKAASPAGARSRNRWGEGDRLRAEILAAASRLLEELGSDEALSLRGVAREVGIAAPSIYRHFADKTELVWAALADKYARLAETMAERNAAVPEDQVLERLRGQLHAYCEFGLEQPGHYRLMFGVRQSQVEPERLPEHPVRPVMELLVQAIEECVAAGYRSRLECWPAVMTLWAACHGRVAIWHTLPGQQDPAMVYRFVDDLISLVLDTPVGGGDAGGTGCGGPVG